MRPAVREVAGGAGATRRRSDEASKKSRAFIACSRRGRKVAEQIRLGIGDEVSSTIRSRGLFGSSGNTTESLARETRECDFAVLVIAPDDPGRRHGRPCTSPRDNFVFELGLFLGAAGREKTLVVCQENASMELLGDLAGVEVAFFTPGQNGDWETALAPVCARIKTEIRKASATGPGPSAQAAVPTVSKIDGTDRDRSARSVATRTPAKSGPGTAARRRRRRSLGTARAGNLEKTHRIVDISVTGALIETDGELPTGQLLDLDLVLENGTTAHVTAKIVRVQHPTWGLVGGVGVAFTEYGRGAEAIIAKYVDADRPAC